MAIVQQGDLIIYKRKETGATGLAVVNEIFISSKETVLFELHYFDPAVAPKFVHFREIEIIKVYREVSEC